MSAMSVFRKKQEVVDAAPQRDWLSPLNLHWAGVAALALAVLYILVRMGLLWHNESDYNAAALAAQRQQLHEAEVEAQQLRGLDAKLERSTAEADRFYRERLPVSDSEMLAEMGALTKAAGVRLTRNSYQHVQVLQGSAGELTEVRMDATLSGDYRPLVKTLNALERDRKFFLINAVTLTGQQTGNVSLRLRLTTYLRPLQVLGPALEDAKAIGGAAQ
jgi:type IV pilus assembly protein PilO